MSAPDVSTLKAIWSQIQDKKAELKPLMNEFKRCREELYDHLIEEDMDECEVDGVSAKRVKRTHVPFSEKALRKFAEDGMVNLDEYMKQGVEKEKLVLKIKD